MRFNCVVVLLPEPGRNRVGRGWEVLAEGVGLEGGYGVTVRFGRPAFLNKEGGYKIWVKHFTFTSHSRFLQS